jgi:preprotein translocase subunit SecG
MGREYDPDTWSPIKGLGASRRKDLDRVINALLITVHLLVSLTLVLFVLLHAGRGGGLSDMFGGAAGGSSAGSTVVEKNLDRLTVMAAIVFAFTTILLSIRLT